ncbi:MAG TPA: amidase, partial [Kofleriaceae bacterium]|nr:amidase [Kofleriaceae bacterium]
MNVSDLDATGQAELVRTGEASPRELVDLAIARIERHNAELGAVIVPLFDRARAGADDAPHGPFRGVPIVIKDICATIAGVPLAQGVEPLRRANRPSAVDSHLVAAVRKAGFVIVGKTNTSELGILPSCEPPAWPPTKNPYDTTRIPGGSSGGSACAVASGMVPIGHANDGGGSIRIPASCCGLFGLKPSRGRVSFAPDFHGLLVAEHVVTRSVRDSAAVLDLLAGVQSGDPFAAPPQLRPYTAELTTPTGPLRIAFDTEHPGLDGSIVDSHPDCVAAVAHAAKLLASLGHHVDRDFPAALRDPEYTPRFLSIWAVNVTTNLDAASRELGRPIEAHEVETLTWALAELGRLVSGASLNDAWQWVHCNTRQVATFWDRYDLWLTPTLATPPAPLYTFRSPPDDPLAGIFAAADFAPFTPPFNATGQPACSIPLYRNADGVPI